MSDNSMSDNALLAVLSACVMAPFIVAAWCATSPAPEVRGSSLACHAAGGWWVAATLDKNGEPKMWACVDDAGRLVRLSEEK